MENNFNFNYFTDFEKDRHVKIGISALVGKISKQIHSHKAGWSTMVANQLKSAGYSNVTVIHDTKTEWSDFDVVLIEHGMEFKGVFNIFGGANDDLYDQLVRLFSPNVRMYSLHVDMPLMGDLIRVRHRTGTDKFKTLLEKADLADEISRNIKTVHHIEETPNLVFGDSHCFSVYRPGFMVYRNDGLTLHGALTRGFDTYVYPWVKDLIVYAGNIDVRHHLCRQHDPLQATLDLMERYEAELLSLQKSEKHCIQNITVVHVLPVEDESRKIPKTGWYKKAPFFGSRADRAAISKLINMSIDSMCERNDWNVYSVPEIFFKDKETYELSFDVMEKPQSVHISREFHYWNYELNKQNEKIK